MTDILDYSIIWKPDFVAPRKPVLIQLNPAAYLAVEGAGEPGGGEFSTKVGALYAMAYTIKMTRKFGGRQDYPVSKLEAQWWGPDGQNCFASVPKAQWRWRLMIRTPEIVEAKELGSARAALRKRGKAEGTEYVALHSMTEGQCVQQLHVGPYETEGETVKQMEGFAHSKGMELCGLHHEIYISDPRRVPPERIKTILRHPIQPSK